MGICQYGLHRTLTEGWRAISFYQLGGILHDLLMRKPLFEKFRNPYARLVRAVEREVPRVDSSEGDADLRLLAQNCLAKVASQRLDTVKWEDFSQPKIADPMDAARRKIAQHRVAASQALQVPAAPEDLLGIQCFGLRTSIHSAVFTPLWPPDIPTILPGANTFWLASGTCRHIFRFSP